MYNTDLANQIENAVQNALSTNNFSELNKNITTAVNTSIAQIGTNQNRFYQHYKDNEMSMEQLEHVDGEVVNGDARADYSARRRAAQQQEERARYNSRQAQEARRQAAEARRREEAARRQAQHRQYQEHQRAAWQQTRHHQHHTATGSAFSQTAQHHNPTDIVPISRNPAGRVSGTVLTVLGALGLAGCLLMFMLFTIFSGAHMMPYYIYDNLMGALFTPVFFVSTGMFITGTIKRKRIKRFYQYIRQLRGRTYCSIKELSSHIGRSKRFVVKDLRKMISLDMFPEGHIDDQQTCVILNGATYDQYLKAQNSYLARRMEERQSGGRIRQNNSQTNAGSESFTNSAVNSTAAESVANQEKTNSTNRDRRTLPPKVIQVLSAGDNYLTQIREANAAIPGEVISKKLDHLEHIIQKIYARIEEHPEQVDDLDKFINYYLPTTLKLVNAYKDFDAQPVQGDNIQTAKKEIESTLDTIIYAFETLLDSLYEDDALDISTDISVLQTMFAQEGLTKGAFDQAKVK